MRIKDERSLIHFIVVRKRNKKCKHVDFNINIKKINEGKKFIHREYVEEKKIQFIKKKKVNFNDETKKMLLNF